MGVYQDIIHFKNELTAIQDSKGDSDKSLITNMLKALNKFQLALSVPINEFENVSLEEKIRLVEKLEIALDELINEDVIVPGFLQDIQPDLESREDFFDRIKKEYWAENYAILIDSTLKSIEARKREQPLNEQALKSKKKFEASLVDKNYSRFFNKKQISQQGSLKVLINNLMVDETARLLLELAQKNSVARATEGEMIAIKKQAFQRIVRHGMKHELFTLEELMGAVNKTPCELMLMEMLSLQPRVRQCP